jgi:cytoskeletal protein RodZ
MTYDDLDFDDDVDFDDDFGEDVDSGLPEEASNRTFIIIAGALGGLALLAIICLIVYFVAVRPQQVAEQQELAAQATEVEGEVAQMVQQTAESADKTAQAAQWTSTPTDTPILTNTPTSTATSEPTSVVAVEPTEEAINATATALQATANHNALMLEATLTAQFSPTPTYTDPSALPEGGFADSVGLPALLGLAALFIVIIFLARRLRTA